MPFVGDFLVRDSRDGDKDPPPNLVWTEIWGGRYSNIYGNVIPQLLSDRGYVFWDAEIKTDSRGSVVQATVG